MTKTIALLGQPNSGKSTLYNGLTGSHQHVGNWPGKTVEQKEGYFTIDGERYIVADLPGSYSLSAGSQEEEITRAYIASGKADIVCILADASQLRRNLYMLADFAPMRVPAVLILNMMDVAKLQGKSIDTALLSKRLGITVVPFVAADRKKYPELKDILRNEFNNPKKIDTEKLDALCGGTKSEMELANARFQWIEALLDGVVTGEKKRAALSKADRIFTSRRWGKPFSVAVMLLAFVASMIMAVPLMGLGSFIPRLASPLLHRLMQAGHAAPFLESLAADLIPNVVYFAAAMAGFVVGVTFTFTALEETGFLARISYAFDGTMTKLGLQGKSICPMLMGLGCTIGGAAGARVIDNWGQRILTIMLTWAVPCAAIATVMPTLATIFFGAYGILVMLGIYAYMFFMIFITAKIFGNKLSPAAERTGMLMELPPYHRPRWGNVLYTSFAKSWDIFKRALRVIFLISVIFWALSFSSTGRAENSIIYRFGTYIEPVTRFFGLGWQTFIAFLASAVSKEAVLGVLNSLYVGTGDVMTATFLAKTAGASSGNLAAVLPEAISKAEALAFMFAVSFNVPCLMAVTATYRETHSLKWTASIAFYYIASALVLSFIVYHIAVLVM